MRQRSISTAIWENNQFRSLSVTAQRVLIYYLTNDRVGMSGYYRCPNAIAQYHLKMDDLDVLQAYQKEIEESRFGYFYQDWVYMACIHEHATFNSPKHAKIKQEERKSVPKNIFKYFQDRVLIGYQSRIDSPSSTSTSFLRGGAGENKRRHPTFKEILQKRTVPAKNP